MAHVKDSLAPAPTIDPSVLHLIEDALVQEIASAMKTSKPRRLSRKPRNAIFDIEPTAFPGFFGKKQRGSEKPTEFPHRDDEENRVD